MTGAARVPWPPPTGAAVRRYRGLGLEFTVDCGDAELAALVGRALGMLAVDDSDTCSGATWTVVRHQDGTVGITRDGSVVTAGCATDMVLDWLLWDVNQTVAGTSDSYLLLHAAAVSRGGRGVILAGASGAGKSTLAAALVGRGFDYLTDELVAIDPATTVLHPYAKGLGLDDGSRRALAAMGILGHQAHESCVPCDQLRPGSLSAPCPATVVLFPQYTAGGQGADQPTAMGPADSVLELMAHSVHMERHGGDGLAGLADILGRIPAYRLPTADLSRACHIVNRLVEEA